MSTVLVLMNALLVILAAIMFLVLAAAIWFVCVVRSTEYSAWQTFFWLIAKFFTRFLWRMRIEEPFPIQGPGNAVIICNHRSSVDPFFIQVSLRRVAHWMVAREYCEHPVMGFFLRIAQVIPVNRGGIDTAATKSAIRLVSAGGMVGMLPEGRINRSDQFMGPVRPGAILIALEESGAHCTVLYRRRSLPRKCLESLHDARQGPCPVWSAD